jgi:hypothetical protein
MFQALNKVTGGKPRATRRTSGGRRVILKALIKGSITYRFFPRETSYARSQVGVCSCEVSL